MSQALANTRQTPAQILVNIPRPVMPTCQRYRSELTRPEGDWVDGKGKQRSGYLHVEPVGQTTRLIPLADCKAVIVEIETALRVALYDQADAMARTLIARYPTIRPHDVEGYVFEITRMFSEAPPDLGARAVDILRRCKFPPNTGDIAEVLDPLVADRRWALSRARSHLAEHRRRNAPTLPKSKPCQGGDYQVMLAGMYQAAGLPVPEGELSISGYMAASEAAGEAA